MYEDVFRRDAGVSFWHGNVDLLDESGLTALWGLQERLRPNRDYRVLQCNGFSDNSCSFGSFVQFDRLYLQELARILPGLRSFELSPKNIATIVNFSLTHLGKLRALDLIEFGRNKELAPQVFDITQKFRRCLTRSCQKNPDLAI